MKKKKAKEKSYNWFGGGLETTLKLKNNLAELIHRWKQKGETLSQGLELAQETEGGRGKGHTLRILGKIF